MAAYAKVLEIFAQKTNEALDPKPTPPNSTTTVGLQSERAMEFGVRDFGHLMVARGLRQMQSMKLRSSWASKECLEEIPEVPSDLA